LAEDNNKNKGLTEKPAKNGSVLRCINIDCIFNSSNEFGGVRNTCSHPKVAVESRFADITIAICSEFRSKKDYSFEKPTSIIDLKTGEKQEIISIPEIGVTPVKTVTTKELEESVSTEEDKEPAIEQQIIIPTVKPQIIQPEPVIQEELTFSEKYNLSDNPKGDFLILRKLYQPYTKRGFIFSVIIHLVIIFIMFLFIVPKDEEDPNNTNLQRIVVVEDLEMPKFDPPDVDKMKEDEKKSEEKSDETKNIRPNITKKTVIPKINRPTIDKTDTNKVSFNDSNKIKNDSNLTKLDTTKFIMPDSLRQNFSENEVGLSMDYLRDGWKIIDNKTITGEKSFTGVIMRLDSLNPDVKNITVFIHMDDPAHSAYNKNTYKNIFTMDDSTIAYVTDPIKMSGKSTEFKYFLFTDPTGQKNIYINAQFNNEEVLQSYKPKVDAVIRTIKILPPKPKTP
jgi:hypothetical protein